MIENFYFLAKPAVKIMQIRGFGNFLQKAAIWSVIKGKYHKMAVI